MEKFLLIVIPMAICFSAVAIPILLWQWDRKRRNVRPPVSEKMLRPPGESLRLKIQKLDEKINECFAACMMAGALMGVFMFSYPKDLKVIPPLVAVLILVVMLSPIVAFYSIRGFKALTERTNYQLGFDGERFVGELLNQLMLEGCHVFHDFPADKKWNIDHIIVAPTGVFVVETKTLRKQDAPPGKRDNTIVYDGAQLEFPHETHDWGLQQAKDNARWLSTWLGSATGEKVFVRPILTFPGWWVESRSTTDDIKVVNPKQIPSIIFSCRDSLSGTGSKRIVHQLDQKVSRDVEF